MARRYPTSNTQHLSSHPGVGAEIGELKQVGLDRAEDPQGGGVGMLLLGGARPWKAAGALRNAGGAAAHTQPRRGGQLCAHPRAVWPGPGCAGMAESGAGIRGRKRKEMERQAGTMSRAASAGNAAEVKKGEPKFGDSRGALL